MANAVEHVKIGTRVVYAARVGDVDKVYDAVALSQPALGHHPGLKCASYLLNLAYLDDAGDRHQVMAAALLTDACTSEHLDTFAVQEAQRSHHFTKKTIAEQDQVAAEHRERLVANPRTTGWRPYKTYEQIQSIADDLMDVTAE